MSELGPESVPLPAREPEPRPVASESATVAAESATDVVTAGVAETGADAEAVAETSAETDTSAEAETSADLAADEAATAAGTVAAAEAVAASSVLPLVGHWPVVPGGLRDTVRQELIARQLDEQIAARYPVGQRLRILDAGMGQGTQALRLARAGHTVTGLESDPELLTAARESLATEPAGIRERVRLIQGDGRETGVHFLPGSFDVVLCHGVLMYADAPDALLAGLARMLAPGGLLSLVVRNAEALAMRPGLAGDWAGALGAFESDVYADRGGAKVRADRLDALTSTLAGIAAPLHAWYGVLVFTDGLPADEGLPAADELERLLTAEDRAGRTDPYRRIAGLLHLCGVRG